MARCFLISFLFAVSLFFSSPANAEQEPFECPEETPIHSCIIDRMLDAYAPYHPRPYAGVSGLHPAAGLDYYFSNQAALVAEHGSPAQIQRMLDILDAPPEKLFIPFRKENRKTQENGALVAKLLLMAAQGKHREVAKVLHELTHNKSFRPSGAPPQHPIISFYINRQDLDRALQAVKELYTLKFHIGRNSIVWGDMRVFVTFPLDNLVTDFLLENRPQDAMQVLAAMGLSSNNTSNARLLVASYARQRFDKESRAYFESFCKDLLTAQQGMPEENIPYSYAKTIGSMAIAGCLRANARFAAAVRHVSPAPPPPDTKIGDNRVQQFTKINNAWKIAESFQKAHAALAEAEKKGLPLDEPVLERIAVHRPEVAADACKKTADADCLKRLFRLLEKNNAESPSSPEGRRALFDNLNGTSYATSLDSLKREFGYIPALPVPEKTWPSPTTRAETMEKLRECQRAQKDGQFFSYTACLQQTALDAVEDARAKNDKLLLRQMHIINPHKDWATQLTLEP
ncbi:MAG TPA: hypothetical protein PLX33_10970 [Alphaproteobacteria bacterium]|nr:hypothetical protein [Alphaproteobacteria bacterium]